MPDWKSLTPDEKIAACRQAVIDGAVTSTEVGAALGCSRGAVLGICRRHEINLFAGPKVVKERARRASEHARRHLVEPRKPRSSQKRRPGGKGGCSPDPSKPHHRPHAKPKGLPVPGEGVSLLVAIDNRGCRYPISDPTEGFNMEVCGKPLTKEDEKENFHFCAACQPHLINISEQTKKRQALHA